MTTTEFLAPIRALCVEYNMLPRGETVLLALSGGRDSMALLQALLQLREPLGFSLCAAHFNHKLRGAESDRDADFVRERCTDWGVLLYEGAGDVRAEAARTKRGAEETARNLRYAFLEDAAAEAGAVRIATAHHADDNLETLLLHLTRGAGLRGLSGIPPLRGAVVRPLLSTPRAAIEAYVAQEGLPFVEDSSNADQNLRRNRLRHVVIPILRDLNPQVAQSAAFTQRGLREDEAYLEASATALFRQANRAEDGIVIARSVLNHAPRALAVRVLRRMLEEIEAPMPTWVHLNGILLLAAGSDPSAALHLPGGVLVQRLYDDLLLAWDHAHEPLPALASIPLCSESETALGDWFLRLRHATAPLDAVPTAAHCYLARDGIGASLCVRARAVGDTLALPGRHGKTLKKLMIEEKIPRRERERLPVLADEHGLLAVASLGAARGRLAKPGEAAIAVQWSKREARADRMNTASDCEKAEIGGKEDA